jgi:methionyl-tRNA formyltransferase
MRIAFVGAVESSLVALRTLIRCEMVPVLVVTLPPEAAARHSDFADLAEPAAAAGAGIHFTRNINTPETIEAIKAAQPDICLVVGWSQLCKDEFRNIAPLGALGYHPAPLPRFRGRAVIPWTIISGEAYSGSTIFRLDEGTDSGFILAQERFALAPDETARSLYNKHMQSLQRIIPQALAKAAAGEAGEPQDEDAANYCAKRTPEDGLIDWKQPAEAVLRLIRGVGEPYPGAFTFEGGERIIIDSARLSAERGRFIGVAGQVQTHTREGMTVLCGDGAAIEILAWRNSSGNRPKMHARLANRPDEPNRTC